MNEKLIVPEKIRSLIEGKEYISEDIGKSKAGILIFDDFVLKIDEYNARNEETIGMMRWLEGKIPVPKVICYEKDREQDYLLMSKIPGRMSCDDYYMERPEELIGHLSEAFRMLWNVDISDCPRNRDLDVELAEARYRVEHGLVDVDDAEPATFGPGGFKDPEDLLGWLERNRPDYEPVLSHGDLCLPNIFIENSRISGLIDLGDTGVGDKWRDIALCYRSLRWNAEGAYGGKVYPDVKSMMLFDALGIEPDMDKLRYYILLDELF